MIDTIINWLFWLHNGAGLSFQAQVAGKIFALAVLFGMLMFIPDGELAKNKRLFPLRMARTWMAISALLLIADYSDNGFAKHLVLINFYWSVIGMVWANRWAAKQLAMTRDYQEWRAKA